MQVRNSLNFSVQMINREVNTSLSKTVPDQTLSMRQIYERFTRQLPIAGQKNPIFETVEPDFTLDGINIEALDLAELQELAEDSKRAIGEEKNRKAKAAKQKQTEAIEAEVAKRLAEQSATSQGVAGDTTKR